MNSNKAKTISLEKLLQKQGYYPTKTNGDDNWYFSPFRKESTPSFKINTKLNFWYDFGELIGGNTADYLMFKFGFTFSETLEYLKSFANEIDTFSFQKQNSEMPKTAKTEIKFINKAIPIQHIALVQYLKSRQINNYKNIEQLREIHYTINNKNYFALGFKNNTKGWEIRSKYAKICLGKKDTTLITYESKTLRIFEGFFDYLSIVQVRENLKMEESDYLILNSVALLIKNISVLKNYETIELYLDNDCAGDKYTDLIIGKFEQAIDCRTLYKGYKDLNESIMLGGLKDRV